MAKLNNSQRDEMVLDAIARINDLGMDELMAMHVASGIVILMTCGYDSLSAYKNAKSASLALRPYIESKLREKQQA